MGLRTWKELQVEIEGGNDVIIVLMYKILKKSDCFSCFFFFHSESQEYL